MKRVVKNPTSRTKAVRDTGGHKTILPGAKVSVDCEWSEAEELRYAAAGLTFKKVEPETVDDDAAKAAKAAAEAAKVEAEQKAKAKAKAESEKAAPVAPVVPTVPKIPTK